MKKGFTLIELLAVIIVLAVLLVIAVPKVTDLFDSSSKSTFLTEAKNVFKMAELVIMNGDASSYIYSEDDTKLSMDGNELTYCININDDGDITHIVVSNGEYYLEGDLNFSNLDVDDIVEDSDYTITCGD